MGGDFSPLEMTGIYAGILFPVFACVALISWVAYLFLLLFHHAPRSWLSLSLTVTIILMVDLVTWEGALISDQISFQRETSRIIADNTRHTHVLTSPLPIVGGVLPAGATVFQNNPSIMEVTLPGAAIIDGVSLKGTLWLFNNEVNGRVTLSRDQNINGVPCRANDNVSLIRGKLSQCTLAANYSAFDRVWREGTNVRVGGVGWYFRVPGSAREMYFGGATPTPNAQVVYPASTPQL